MPSLPAVDAAITLPPETRIRVSNLGKRYYLDPQKKGLARLFRRSQGAEFWALKNVSFEINRGERVGIIGKNGAGKSTLLKILSRVLVPTTGEAVLRGRTTALLEIGTGFNPNLTGRENVFLTASIYGLAGVEIEDRFESIVDFAEIGQFIDSPVKHYSTGMRARLGFAVLAHLDPDTLMLDEVLSVGDGAFQRKCLERMNDMTGAGRTLLFVSHSIGAITRFCDRCIWMEKGQIVDDGPAPEICDKYSRQMLSVSGSYAGNVPSGSPASLGVDSAVGTAAFPAPCRLLGARVLDADGNQTSTVRLDTACGIEIDFEVSRVDMQVEPALHFIDENGDFLFVVAFTDPQFPIAVNTLGRFRTVAQIDKNLLNEGLHLVTVCLTRADPLERYVEAERALAFTVYEVHSSQFDTTVARGRYARNFPGVMRPRLEWNTHEL